ncbi:MAG: hypothetical protein GWP04_03325 [Gammaproteobacteria bacterium]|nr:hypothetical protein [Gammaproteobacteria bacterium]
MARSVERMIGYRKLLTDLDEGGCPVCRGSVHAAARYLESLLWENVNDSGVREELRHDHGFCREHSLALLQVAAARSEALGVAIVYEDLLGHIEAEVAAEGTNPRRRSPRFWSNMSSGRSCRACAVGDDVAVNYLRIIATCEPDTDVGRRLETATLCFPHLSRGREIHGIDHVRLETVYLRGSASIRSELRHLIDHADYRRADEPLGQEKDAWVRAAHLIVGSPVHGAVAEPRQ